MKTNRLIWALGWVTMGSIAALGGCGGDDDDAGGGGDGKGGKGGSSGSGTGGKATGGSSTGGKATGGSSTGGTATGGTATGGTPTGGTAGAAGSPGGAGGESGGGGQTRGEVCVDYCAAYYANNCDSYGTNSYTDQPTCEFVCANSAWDLGAPGEVGDTVWCRLDHANNAAGMTMRELHCGHASQTSTGVCVP